MEDEEYEYGLEEEELEIEGQPEGEEGEEELEEELEEEEQEERRLAQEEEVRLTELAEMGSEGEALAQPLAQPLTQQTQRLAQEFEKMYIEPPRQFEEPGVKEYVNLNIPLIRRDPYREEKYKVMGYQYDKDEVELYFINKLADRLLINLPIGEVNDDTKKLMKRKAVEISNMVSKKYKQIEAYIMFMGRLLFYLDGDKVARRLRLRKPFFEQLQAVLKQFQETIYQNSNIIFDTRIYTKINIPEEYTRGLKKSEIRKPVLHAPPLALMTYATRNIVDWRIAKNFFTKSLAKMLFKIYLASQPKSKELEYLTKMNDVNFMNDPIMQPYITHVSNINDIIFKKYLNADYIDINSLKGVKLQQYQKNMKDYIAHMSMVMLHLDRDNIIGWFSNTFQTLFINNPQSIVIIDYVNQMYPQSFRSTIFTDKQRKKLWVYTNEEIKRNYDEIYDILLVMSGNQAPTKIESVLAKFKRIQEIKNITKPIYGEFIIKRPSEVLKTSVVPLTVEPSAILGKRSRIQEKELPMERVFKLGNYEIQGVIDHSDDLKLFNDELFFIKAYGHNIYLIVRMYKVETPLPPASKGVTNMRIKPPQAWDTEFYVSDELKNWAKMQALSAKDLMFIKSYVEGKPVMTSQGTFKNVIANLYNKDYYLIDAASHKNINTFLEPLYNWYNLSKPKQPQPLPPRNPEILREMLAYMSSK